MPLRQDSQQIRNYGPLAGVSAGAMVALVCGAIILLTCRHQLAEVATVAAVALMVVIPGGRRSPLKSWTRCPPRSRSPPRSPSLSCPRAARTRITTSTARGRLRPPCRRCRNDRPAWQSRKSHHDPEERRGP
jgi:hypothetical protein